MHTQQTAYNIVIPMRMPDHQKREINRINRLEDRLAQDLMIMFAIEQCERIEAAIDAGFEIIEQGGTYEAAFFSATKTLEVSHA